MKPLNFLVAFLWLNPSLVTGSPMPSLHDVVGTTKPASLLSKRATGDLNEAPIQSPQQSPARGGQTTGPQQLEPQPQSTDRHTLEAPIAPANLLQHVGSQLPNTPLRGQNDLLSQAQSTGRLSPGPVYRPVNLLQAQQGEPRLASPQQSQQQVTGQNPSEPSLSRTLHVQQPTSHLQQGGQRLVQPGHSQIQTTGQHLSASQLSQLHQQSGQRLVQPGYSPIQTIEHPPSDPLRSRPVTLQQPASHLQQSGQRIVQPPNSQPQATVVPRPVQVQQPPSHPQQTGQRLAEPGSSQSQQSAPRPVDAQQYQSTGRPLSDPRADPRLFKRPRLASDANEDAQLSSSQVRPGGSNPRIRWNESHDATVHYRHYFPERAKHLENKVCQALIDTQCIEGTIQVGHRIASTQFPWDDGVYAKVKNLDPKYVGANSFNVFPSGYVEPLIPSRFDPERRLNEKLYVQRSQPPRPGPAPHHG